MPDFTTYSLYPPPSTHPHIHPETSNRMAFLSNKTAAAADTKSRPQTTRAGGVLGVAQRGVRYNPPVDRGANDVLDVIQEPQSSEGIVSTDQSDIPFRPSSSAAWALPQRPTSRQSAYRTPAFTASQNEGQPYISDVASDTTGPESREQQSGSGSTTTYDTDATSIHTLPALQTKGPVQEYSQLEPVAEDDPTSYDLLEPAELQRAPQVFQLESRAQQLFSQEHLQAIFDDPQMLLKFTSFLGTHRPASVPTLIYYLDAMKALRAIKYANAVAEALDPLQGHEFTSSVAPPTRNLLLEEKANKAFRALVDDALPAYITDTWVRVVSTTIQRRITGSLPPHLREASEGLAEVFCLSDPSRPDNPIVFASEEFNRTTQYGMSYAIGRNCRFLQGPMTSPDSVRRLREAVVAGKDHCETFVNYRRDGSPFMNLLMIAPLRDSRGNLRYHIGAQVDVTGLAKECTHLDALQHMLGGQTENKAESPVEKKDEFQELSEMFNLAELDIVRKYGGRMHREHVEEKEDSGASWHRPRILLQEYSTDDVETMVMPNEAARPIVHGKLSGVYQHYLLIRPYPSLRILFASPSLRVPGILQSPFMNRIGGSERVRDELVAALADGRGVTAKIRWVSRSEDEGRNRWVHCTPLMGGNGQIGVWMVVLVDDETSRPVRRFRNAPPVALDINGRTFDPKTGHSIRKTPSQGDRASFEETKSDFDFRI